MFNVKRVAGAVAILWLVGVAFFVASKAPLHAQTVGSWSCSLSGQPWSQGPTVWASFTCTNGSQTQNFQEQVNQSDPNYYTDEAAALIAQITGAPATPAPGQPITPTPVTQPTPPPAYVTQFQSDYALLMEYEAAISQGLITASDTGYTAQLAKVQAEFSANETNLLPYILIPR